jgi:hypothetical protein
MAFGGDAGFGANQVQRLAVSPAHGEARSVPIRSDWNADWNNCRGVDHAATGLDSAVQRRWQLSA